MRAVTGNQISGRMGLGAAFLVLSATIALLLTAAAAFVNPAIAQPRQPEYLASGVVMVLVDLLVVFGLGSLAASTAMAPGRFKRLAFGLLILSSLAMVPAEALLRVDFDTGNAAFGVAGPLQAVGLVLVGVGIIRTHRWSTWRRYTPLVMGLYIPFVMVPLLITSAGTSLVALAGYHMCVLLVGLAFGIEEGRLAAATRPSAFQAPRGAARI
jgi:hypothetical protein